MEANAESRWTASQAFIAEKLRTTREQMDSVVLNRVRWDKVRDDYRMLVFLQDRAQAPDFQGVREELNRVVEGRLRVPDVGTPRLKATSCLTLWADELESLEGERQPH